ncbi:hypothetical protein ACFLZ0_00845 [Patescibacteria group bacterium]
MNKNIFFYISSIGILLFLFIFLVTCSWIGYGVREQCSIAQTKYQGDCVEALMQSFEKEQNNSVVWALGQLGDNRALPLLQSYYTGEIKKTKEKWDEGLSQYELKKAIKLLDGGFNASAIIWR